MPPDFWDIWDIWLGPIIGLGVVLVVFSPFAISDFKDWRQEVQRRKERSSLGWRRPR